MHGQVIYTIIDVTWLFWYPCIRYIPFQHWYESFADPKTGEVVNPEFHMKVGTTTHWIRRSHRKVVRMWKFITCKLSPLRWFVMDPVLPSWSVPNERQEVGIEKPPGTVPMTVIRPSSDISLLDNTHGAEPSVWMNSARLTTSWFSKSLSSLCMSLYPYRTTHLHFQSHWTLTYYTYQIKCSPTVGLNFGNCLVLLAITNEKDCHLQVLESKLRCQSYKKPFKDFLSSNDHIGLVLLW